jgi:hypothetical protein
VEFRRLAAELDFTQGTLVEELRHKVSVELEKMIVIVLNLTDVFEIARKCEPCDQNTQKDKSREPHMARRTAASTTTTHCNIHYELYNLDLATEEILKTGSSFRYKEPGHTLKDCPRPPSKPSQIRLIEARTPTSDSQLGNAWPPRRQSQRESLARYELLPHRPKMALT